MTVLLIEDAKAHLNLDDATSDSEVWPYIRGAEAALARRVGPLEPTQITRRIPGRPYRGIGNGRGTRELVLPVTPVISLVSVTPVNGTPYGITGLDVTPGGIVRFPTGWGWFAGAYFDVVWMAGRTVSSEENEDLYLAIQQLLLHYWMTQRGPSTRRGVPEPRVLSGPMPDSVLELIAPFVLPSVS